MSIAASTVNRIAPNGAQLRVKVPEAMGSLQWFGISRFTGPAFTRTLILAERGHQDVIPRKIFPGGSQTVSRQRGFDLVLYEAADRSNSCLVWIGPHHEATVWFGGPAPRSEVMNRTVSGVSFLDSPDGARVTAAAEAASRVVGTTVIGTNDEFFMATTDVATGRGRLPAFRGAPRGDGAEVWKEKRDLDSGEAAEATGTPYEWRYTLANSSAIVDVVFLQRPAERAATDDRVESVLAELDVSWS